MVRGRESEKHGVRGVLSEAGLIDIPTDDFPKKIKEAKNAVMERLSELLEVTTDIQERDSAAYSLATLIKVETTLKKAKPKD